jgi:erythrin-vacuolar iron transport family protein
MKTLAELAEREMLALAISSEEEDSRIYMTFAEDLTERYPASAKWFSTPRIHQSLVVPCIIP